MRLIILFMLAVLLMSGCASPKEQSGASSQLPGTMVTNTPVKSPGKENTNVSKAERNLIKVYYFFHPECPNCQAVKPLIDYLLNSTDITFDMCNVEYFSNCSNMSKQLAYTIKEKTGFFGTPTAVIQENNSFRVFIGKYQVVEMVSYLRNYTYIPNIPLKNTEMPVERCFACHEKKNLRPPSTMTCSYCCHGVV